MNNIISQEQKNRIDKFCTKHNLHNYIINGDGSIDVEGNVDISYSDYSEIPINFKNVVGGFYCNSNQLTTLNGCPITVGGIFDCSDNLLETLEGCPITVGADFYASSNNIWSIEHCPTEVGGGIYLHGAQLEDNLMNLSEDELIIFVKYQQYYDIWSNGLLNEDAMIILIDEIKDGLR
jgi:hypothetical protein